MKSLAGGLERGDGDGVRHDGGGVPCRLELPLAHAVVPEQQSDPGLR